MSADDRSGDPFAEGARFPNETDEYREARLALLNEELELRRRIERVSEQRRSLPAGGRVPTDYEFEVLRWTGRPAGNIEAVRLSDLFAKPEASLLIYSFMFGPEMERPCPSCTSILDALEGQVSHVRQRINFAVVAKSPIDRVQAFASERGWKRLPLLSSAGNSYNADYFGEDPTGSQLPMLNVFERRDGEIRHVYGTEMLFSTREAGQGPRHVDSIWPLWSLFDFVREGRGEGWNPALSYD